MEESIRFELFFTRCRSLKVLCIKMYLKCNNDDLFDELSLSLSTLYTCSSKRQEFLSNFSCNRPLALHLDLPLPLSLSSLFDSTLFPISHIFPLITMITSVFLYLFNDKLYLSDILVLGSSFLYSFSSFLSLSTSY